MWQKWIGSLLDFNRKERRGLLFLLVLIISLWLVPIFFSEKKPKISASELEMLQLKKTEAASAEQNFYRGNRPSSISKRTNRGGREEFNPANSKPFFFNPNTASDQDWKNLGIPDRNIQTIRNYLSKGGKFRKPDDLARIYGFPPAAYELLMPYVSIPKPDTTRFQQGHGSDLTRQNNIRRFIPRKPIIVPVNAADSAAWESLPGIGPKLALRIINFRSKLGGFHTIEQVGETFGLPDSTFEAVRPFLILDSLSGPSVLNLNNCTPEALQSHPYLSYRQAKAIIAYRQQHGPFIKKEDVLRVALVTEEIYSRLAPYLTVN